jgi:heme/copper-type cytochrome/quinol oxidase subunit 4
MNRIVSPGGVCPVRCHLRVVAVLAVALISYGALIQAFHLLNRASDQAWYSGIAVIFGLIFLVPVIVREIWRKL